jgi:hypothetical protein
MEIAVAVLVGWALVSIFEFITDKIGPGPSPEPDKNYEPTKSDMQMIEEGREIIKTYFPDGIENTMISLSADARIEKIKEITAEIAAKYKIEVNYLTFLSVEQLVEKGNSQYTAGYYDFEQKGIAINVNMLLLNNGEMLKDVINTIFHECRHAYQFMAIHHPDEYPVDPQTILDWANNFTNYISPELDLKGYMNQPIEYDARNFADYTLKDL